MWGVLVAAGLLLFVSTHWEALAPGQRFALLLALVAVLGGKARREERALELAYPDYAAYRARTPAIIPRLPWLDWRAL